MKIVRAVCELQYKVQEVGPLTDAHPTQNYKILQHVIWSNSKLNNQYVDITFANGAFRILMSVKQQECPTIGKNFNLQSLTSLNT